jgi:hypothetical protein
VSVPWDDEDDWVGEPPEGRHSADRSDPGYWWRHRPPDIVAGMLVVVLIVLALVVLLR